MCFQEFTKVVHFKEIERAAKMIEESNPQSNISSAKMKFSRNEENTLRILHINDNICCTCSSIGMRILREFFYFCEFLNTFLESSNKWIISFKFFHGHVC